jgi:REP element-mobilizing transposase RayT
MSDRRERVGQVVGATPCGRPDNEAASLLVEKWLLKIPENFTRANIDKYVIMSDHIHIILSLAGDHTGSPLPTIIDWFKTMTTNEYIKGVYAGVFPQFDRRLWQRSYYEHIIRNQLDYETNWIYIQNNPLNLTANY